jgi:hypothetical protein
VQPLPNAHRAPAARPLSSAQLRLGASDMVVANRLPLGQPTAFARQEAAFRRLGAAYIRDV